MSSRNLDNVLVIHKKKINYVAKKKIFVLLNDNHSNQSVDQQNEVKLKIKRTKFI